MCGTHGALLFALHLAAFALVAVAAKHQQHHHHHHHHGQPPAEQSREAAAAAKATNAIGEDVMYNYLMQFDYLPKSDVETGALRTEEQLKDAIRNLQSFGNIPVTGEIDPATAKLIQKPRCGVGDNKRAYNFSPDNLDHGNSYSLRVRRRRYVLQGPRWDKMDLTWSLVNQSMAEAGQVRSSVSRALKVWENNSKLTFREVYSDQADIQILFARRDHGDGYKFDGPGQVLAHAFYPGVGRGGDAHFDVEENWVFDANGDDSKGTNFLNVALHELGHSLGLGHSSDQNAVMFPWYQNNEVDGKLPDDDRNGIQELYGSKDKTWGPYRPRATPRTTPSTTTMRSMVYYPQSRPSYPNRNPNYPNYYPQKPNYEPNYPRQPERRTTTTTSTTTTQRPRRYPTARTSPTKPQKPRKLKPNTCMTTYDAISMIRSELFIFRGQFLWRIGRNGLYPGYPTETRRHWAALPENFSKVDAVFENHERKIVFFIGRQYFIFDSVTLAEGYPQPLTSLGLPSTLSHVDAAFVWGHNNRTFLTSGTFYWRMDDSTGRVETVDYPRDMSIWAGVGYNIDAAFQYNNGKTYFFKNYGYWEFDDSRMHVAHARPKPSALKWMQCARSANEVEEGSTSLLVSDENEATVGSGVGYDSRLKPLSSLCGLALLLLLSFGCRRS